jgi:hypothetical protein
MAPCILSETPFTTITSIPKKLAFNTTSISPELRHEQPHWRWTDSYSTVINRNDLIPRQPGEGNGFQDALTM